MAASVTILGFQSSLGRVISDLRNRNDSVRARAGPALRELVVSASRHLSGESFAKFLNDVNRRIFELIHSTDASDRIAGVLAIDSLIDSEGEESTTKLKRFANYLRDVLPSNENYLTAQAAKTLGRLVQAGGTATTDIVDNELRRALDWLQGDRNENKRYASALIIAELTRTSPGVVFGSLVLLVDSIWVLLRDPKALNREAGVTALSAMLQMMSERPERDAQQRRQWYRKIFEECQKNFKSGTNDSIHASLLVYQELLLHSGEFMASRYSEVCDAVSKHKEHRDTLVRKTVILLIPTLAAYDTRSFVDSHFSIWMNYLFTQLKREKDRSGAFIAIGKIAIEVGHSIGPYLDSIHLIIKEHLSTKGKNRSANEVAIYQCMSMLVLTVGPALTKYLHELLDSMFSAGINDALYQLLVDLSHQIPAILPAIQDRLIQVLYMILCGQPFRWYGHSGGMQSAASIMRDSLPPDLRDVDNIVLALEILGNFNFSGCPLNEWACEAVMPYLDDENSSIRLAATLTAGNIMLELVELGEKSNIDVLAILCEKILAIGVSDLDSSIRCVALSILDERFDHYLSLSDHVRALSVAVNDEEFIVREAAIAIIGRLTIRNPATAMPSFRKSLIQILTELEYNPTSHQKEESAKLLSRLVSSCKRAASPYIESVLKALISNAHTSNDNVSAHIITALGELSDIGGDALVAQLDDIFNIIFEVLESPSSQIKREAALRAICKLAGTAGAFLDTALAPKNSGISGRGSKRKELLTMMIALLKSEPSQAIRSEIVKVMGVLGALDPHALKAHTNPSSASRQPGDSAVPPQSSGRLTEEYSASVAVTACVKILKDPTLSIHHTTVVQAVMYMCKVSGNKIAPLLPQIVPTLLQVMRNSPPALHEFFFQQLSSLVAIVKGDVQEYLADIVKLVQDFWAAATSIRPMILTLLESLVLVLDRDLIIFIPVLLPMLLQALEADANEGRAVTQKALQVILRFGSNLEEFLYLVIPSITRLFDQPEIPSVVRKQAILTVRQLCPHVSFAHQASRIIHGLVRVLSIPSSEIRTAAMDTICTLIYHLGIDFAIFIPTINKVMQKNQIQHERYDMLVGRLLKGEQLPHDLGEEQKPADSVDDASGDSLPKRLPVDHQRVTKAAEVNPRGSREDWTEWMRRFSLELLKESPSQALRACAGVASVYHPLARELFNTSFVVLWSSVFDQVQDEIIRSLKIAIKSQTTPPDILQMLLNLAEFMEQEDTPLPIDIGTLGDCAEHIHAYAKALHYRELEFISEPLGKTTEALLSISHQIQQPDFTIGILTYAPQVIDLGLDVRLKESWLEKLQRWEDALAFYERREREEPGLLEAIVGKIRCLHNLHQFDEILSFTKEKWAGAPEATRKALAPYATAASWGLEQWDLMEEYIVLMKPDTTDTTFFRAILALHHAMFTEAMLYINKTRELMSNELIATISENYDRAYSLIVRVQVLAELEEMIVYKQSYDIPEKQRLIRQAWISRLDTCQKNVDIWHRIINVRRLVISPRDDIDTWISFADLCREGGRINLSEKNLVMLLIAPVSSLLTVDLTANDPKVVFACIKHIWATGEQQKAYETLKLFTNSIVVKLGQRGRATRSSESCQVGHTAEKSIIAECYLKLGEWKQQMHTEIDETIIPDILESYREAKHYDRDRYKAWHAWALFNFEALSYYQKAERTPSTIVIAYAVPSIQGFFRSIALSKGNSLQDTLRLLTLWFRYGYQSHVNAAIREGFDNVSLDTWLQVIPQLIARIHTPGPEVRSLIYQLLADIGKQHPQAIVYSLMVVLKSQSVPRIKAAMAILDKMRIHSANLVDQALMVSQELIRVAILWHEIWHAGLEEAARQCFREPVDIEGMLETLKPLHQVLADGPETQREIWFYHSFGRDLQEAGDWCARYRLSGDMNDINQAWDLYFHVFRKLDKQFNQLTTLELQSVSPKLFNARNLELAIPGSYKSGEPVINIESFAPTLTRMTSKQKPRRLKIKGSDGKDYEFLLKGHEDLRQDERVMQLFGLVNTLLAMDAETFKRHLSIQRYPVIPLSQNSGLIGWVSDSDTLHSLIKDYRSAHNEPVDKEIRSIRQLCGGLYDNLALLQKVEVFSHTLELNAAGPDLYKILWLKSKNSEIWLERRTNYSRSLATMSMVGYILGLGDRHPSNLMLHQFTGKVIHIDFGDCFEVAMHRDKFPEKVPFRLTGMLINAMEVSGIEGHFRITSEHVMRVLRDNKDSLMAVLEAFVYDPLLNWKLLSKGNTENASADSSPVRPNASPDDASAMLNSRKSPRRDAEPDDDPDGTSQPELLNAQALSVVSRISNKLTGRDFKPNVVLDVPSQVQKLIMEATSLENLCQCFQGWCAFW
ncbi:armadillo-type protein [Polychytrium aggregatum]|uniref:armadillo-type protein n=1 Tax=Polychytrium aggregatum TaxID=110093 RepID=UPI0022FED46A|nr:armadillo-type protein [Polychytrium aggregatum]KAI9209819.1 armadillo-type protein [Polychytrium aggregatum]